MSNQISNCGIVPRSPFKFWLKFWAKLLGLPLPPCVYDKFDKYDDIIIH